MTKSTITRERLEQLANFKGAPVTRQEEQELARMALTAMDSRESVELPLDYLQGHKDGLEWAAQLAEANHPETGDWLYDDPIELAKAIRKGPDMPPAQPVADSDPVAIIDQANLDYLRSGADADVWPPEREEMGDVLLYRHAQPAPVVPEEWTIADAVKFCKETGRQDAGAAMDAWNACRAAMLQAGNSPAQSDCCPAQNSVTPAQGGNSLVIPDEMTSGQAYEIGYYYGDPVDVFARGANWMRQHIIDSTLAAAPQLPGSDPATVPGKWIPVSERMPERGDWLVTDGCDFDVQLFNGEQFIPGFVWEDKITHWMPLPAAPQEVNRE
ncbi:TPA: DUF551 domain-containing protein [Klebsiella pneumoniae]